MSKKKVSTGPKALEGLKIKQLSDGNKADRTGIITNVINQHSKSAQHMQIVILWDTDEVYGVDSTGAITIDHDTGVSTIRASELVNKEKYQVFARY